MTNETKPVQTVQLLNTPQDQLLKPLAVESKFLEGELIYLCANDGQAKKCEQEGIVAYTPEEVTILRKQFRTMPMEDYVQYLRSVHEIKKSFPGSRVKDSNDSPPDYPVLEMWIEEGGKKTILFSKRLLPPYSLEENAGNDQSKIRQEKQGRELVADGEEWEQASFAWSHNRDDKDGGRSE